MGKFFQSSNPSPPYTLCCHQLPKRGRLKASRSLNHVLVINDNVYGLTISFEMMSIGWSIDEFGFIVIMQCFGDDMHSMSSRQRYYIGLFILPVIRCLVDKNGRINRINSRAIKRGLCTRT